MDLQQPRRQRGVQITTEGKLKLLAAKRELEQQDNFGQRYTFEALSERTGLNPRTVAKIFTSSSRVDQQTLECLFRAFNLELDTSYYSKPDPDVKRSKGGSSKTRQDLTEAVDVSIFYGRTAELAQLEQWVLDERCRLVALIGIGGIGKTTLAAKLVEQTRHKFDVVIWKSLRDAPSVKAILTNIIEFLSQEQETEIALPQTVGDLITRLLDYLHQHRALVVLDNAEAILCSGRGAGYYRCGYEEYGELVQRVGEVAHSSCLVLTSREKPLEIAYLEGSALPVRALQLRGLDVAPGQEILTAKGCFCTTESQWRVLIEHYGGNPLVLKMVAAAILELFDGNVSDLIAHLQLGALVFQDIEELLGRQFERLSESEREVMYWLAINREPVVLAKLQADIASSVSNRNLLAVLQSLLRRSLIERNAAKFSLQPVVMEYVTERLYRTGVSGDNDFSTRSVQASCTDEGDSTRLREGDSNPPHPPANYRWADLYTAGMSVRVSV